MNDFDQTFVLTSDGLYGWGGNLHGQLGLGHTNAEHSPKRIHFFDDKKVLKNL